MAKKYTASHEVAFYECDINQTMTFPAMLGAVIKTSEEQSDSLGRGTSYVQQQGLTWVITNYQMDIQRMPRVNELIQVTTQAMSYNKYFCYRNFWIHDAEGNELVCIESTFVLMDMENRKMSSVNEDIIAPYESEKIKRIIRGEKIESIEQGSMLPFRVRFYDIDSNQHVNNAMYFNWIVDVLGFDFLTTHNPQKVLIRFDKEVEYGHEIESHFEIVTGETISSRHEIRIGTGLYCEANIFWKKK